MHDVSNGPQEGQDVISSSSIRVSPEIIAEADRVLDELDLLFSPPKPPTDDGDDDRDDEPPTSRTPTGPLSYLAVTLPDGRVLASLDDASDRDLTGRQTITFLVLNDAEIETARKLVGDALFDAASNIVGALPRKP